MVLGNAGLVGIKKLLEFVFIFAGYPAGRVVRCRLKHDRNVEFGADTVSHNFKLQGADNADDIFRTDDRFENTGAAFFGDLLKCRAEVFGFERVKRPDAFEQFRGKGRNTGEVDFLPFGQGVGADRGWECR